MSNKFKTLCVSLIVSIVFGYANIALAVNAKEIIEKSEDAMRGKSLTGNYSITIKTKRWTRVMEVKYQENRGKHQSMLEIYAPVKDAGNRFLLIKNDMWHYIQKTQNTIMIAPSMMLQSWMGSDFSNDDIVKESSLIDDYNQKIIGQEVIDGIKCYKLELNPKPDAPVVWGKIIYFARVSDYLLVRQEFYNEHNVMKKFLSCSNFKVMGGRTIPTLYKMEPSNDGERYTTLEIKSIKFNIPIPERIFSKQNLTRK